MGSYSLSEEAFQELEAIGISDLAVSKRSDVILAFHVHEFTMSVHEIRGFLQTLEAGDKA
ncbi:hypothetical protein [Listeria cornellensis]|uniref:hypothetical protein n=1 Tax=Listeria cornellensis TaxID=1494961 RepID=UPI0004BB8C83|nr:hypothetical protein [Listeria cornellensis]